MFVTAFPRSYQSVFRDACFRLEGVGAPDGIDIGIRAAGLTEPLGVKRFYVEEGVSVNVAPYMRGLFSVEPLCAASLEVVSAEWRTVTPYIEAPGYTSLGVPITCGSEDAPTDSILSAAPKVCRIRPGEKDEVSVLTIGRVKPLIVFSHGGREWIDGSLPEVNTAEMITLVVDANAVCRSFTALTKASADEMTGFTVRLAVTKEIGGEKTLERRYVFDRISRGVQRLAWLNRYGAVDYYTFTEVGEVTIEGSRTRIDTSDGFLTVATSSEQSVTLLSEPCDAASAEWLSELFSSPAVWAVDGGNYEKVEVSGGAVKCSPLHPTVVSVTVGPSKKTLSRKS